MLVCGQCVHTFLMRYFFYLLLLTSFLFSRDFTVASYNVENLFDMQNNGHEYPEYRPNKHGWSHKTLQQKLANISEVICDLNADIIGLQEIENQNALKLLQKSLRQYGCHYKYSSISQTKQSAIQVALLSKFPIQSSRDIIVSRLKGLRNILEVKIDIEDNPLYIYVNHWNSKRSSESKRVASAKALQRRLRTLPVSTEYILLGDFNSNYNEYHTMEPRHNDTLGRTGINHILLTTSNNRLIRECSIKKIPYSHYNLWLELPIYKRWSHNFYGKKQGLDAILLPHSLLDGKGIDYVDGSFNVLKKSYLFHKKGYIYRWEYRNKRHRGKGYSDHLPVIATFSTKAYRQQNCHIKNSNIQTLYQKRVDLPIRLKDVQVIQAKKNQITLQDKKGKEIRLFGMDTPLILGKSYDIIVYQRKFYKGAYEIVDYSIEKEYD